MLKKFLFTSLSTKNTVYTLYRTEFIDFIKENPLKYIESQRNVDPNHVEELLDFQMNYEKKYQEYSMIAPLVLGLYNKEYYIVDGQHRTEVLKKLPKDCKFLLTVLEADTYEELVSFVNLVNLNTKPYVQTKSSFIKDVEAYLLKMFKEYAKNTDKPRIPHFNPNSIVKKMNELDLNISLETFLKEIENLNKYIENNCTNQTLNIMKIKHEHYDLCISKNSQTKYYLGLLPNNSWIDAIRIKTEQKFESYKDIDFTLEPFTNKRVQIPAKMKHALWKKYNQDNMKGKCYICNEEIEFTTFEASHVKASCNGGKTEIDNLRCCCGVCNNHMRTQDLYQYKKKYS